jgi:hypothetical protein
MSALPNRRRAMESGRIDHVMQEFLQQLDLDYHRSVLLLVARAELERLRLLGASPTAGGAASPEVACADPSCGRPDAVRSE